jgi:hypothetical protein
MKTGPTRLELATSGVTGRRSNQLNYDPDGQTIEKLYTARAGLTTDNPGGKDKFADFNSQENKKGGCRAAFFCSIVEITSCRCPDPVSGSADHPVLEPDPRDAYWAGCPDR